MIDAPETSLQSSSVREAQAEVYLQEISGGSSLAKRGASAAGIYGVLEPGLGPLVLAEALI
jgi:hypothetical protein